jgi:PTS system ascorbate-specific IIA component
MTLLANAFGPGSLAIVTSLGNRTEAIKLAGDLLQESGRVQAEYVSSMIDAVDKFGPYIVIAPGIALAHGKPEEGVIETGMSLVVIREPLAFGHGENDPVELVFGLAAKDHSSHIQLMAELATFLGDSEKVNSLLQAGNLVQLRSRLV